MERQRDTGKEKAWMISRARNRRNSSFVDVYLKLLVKQLRVESEIYVLL